MTQAIASPEERFRPVFAHLQAVANYARRRGSADPEGIAAEVMTLAWRKLDSIPPENPRPWLFVTARNLLMAERRRSRRFADVDPQTLADRDGFAVETGDPGVTAALLDLHPRDRETLLLVAWDELSPAQAAAALDISPVAFRVRLFRARRRFQRALDAAGESTAPHAIGVRST
jgi:RNA polymerase sigma-70 factor (ECF subfamily)